MKLIHTLGWATGALFFFYAWILRVAPSVMIDEMMRDLAVGAALIGNLSAFYYYGYAGMQIPVGMLIDRFGPRRLMSGAGIGCAIGCVIFSMSAAFWGVAAGRFLIGASAAFSFVGAMSVAARVVSAAAVRGDVGARNDARHGRRRCGPGAAAAARRQG